MNGMPKATEEEIKKAGLSWNILRTNDSPARQEFIRRFQDDTAYYFHQQLTQKEKDRKAELKQLDIPIDRVRPIIRRIVSKIVKNKPIVAALTEDYANAKGLARRVNAQIHYTMKICKGLSQIRRTLMNCVRGGMGFLQTYVDNVSVGGKREVKIKYVTPKKVIVDFKAQDTLFDDARQIQILEKVMVTDAIRIFEDDPNAVSKIMASLDTSYQDDAIVDDYNDTGGVLVGSAIERSVDEFDDLENMAKNIVGWVELLTTYRKKVKPVFSYKSVDSETGAVYIYNVSKDEAKELRNNGTKIEVSYAPYIHEEISTETYILREQDLDFLDEYPITPMIWEDTENPYPISETFFIRGHQKLQNKYYEVVVHNAQAISFPTVFYEASAFRDKDAAMKAMSTPAGAVELEDGALQKKAVDIKYAQPLNQAFFTLYEQLKHEQEIQASAPSYQSGDANNIPETNKALVNLDSFADRPLSINIDSVEACLERVFKNVLKYQSVIYDEPKLMLIDTNPEGNLTINQPELNTDENGGLIVSHINDDISKIDYDVQIIPDSMSPLDKTTELQYAMAAIQLGVSPEFALKKMPIKGIEEEIEKLDTIRTLKQQLMQSNEMNEELKKQIGKVAQQADKATKSAVETEFESKFKVALARIEDLKQQLNRELRDAKRNNEVMRKHIQKAAQTRNENAVKEK